MKKLDGAFKSILEITGKNWTMRWAYFKFLAYQDLSLRSVVWVGVREATALNRWGPGKDLAPC